MKSYLLLIAIIALSFVSCTTTAKFTSMQMSPVNPVLNINGDKYDIIGTVEGKGTSVSFDLAKEIAIGEALKANAEADALILPKFETTATLPKFGFIKYFKPSKYEVVCKAKAVKLK